MWSQLVLMRTRPDVVTEQYAALGDVGSTPFASLPVAFLCSFCNVELWKSTQASAFNGYDETLEQTWTEIQQGK